MLKRTKFQANPTKISLELIVWVDITSTHTGWIDYTEESLEDLKCAICYTPGWVVEETDEIIKVLSGFASLDEAWSGSFDTIIPKGVIRERTPLLKNWEY